MASNVIAEYLTELGFDVDLTGLKKQFAAAEQVIGSFIKGLNSNGQFEAIQKSIDGISKAAEDAGAGVAEALGEVGVAATEVGGAIGVLVAGVTAFGIKMGEADLNSQKLALSLYTTTANAR